MFYLASTALYLVVFFLFIEKISLDYVAYLEPWYRAILFNGFSILRDPFYNYAPLYMYLMALATLLPFKAVVSIKLVALPVILLGGFLTNRLAKLLNKEAIWGWLGYSLVILAPTIVINSAYWGQADVFYSVALLACVYYLLDKKPFLAMLTFGVAISFKAQGVFLGPFLLLMLLKKQIPWKYLIIPPLVFLLSMVPVIWVGRPWLDVLLTYFNQANSFRHLTMGAATLWAFFPWLDTNHYDLGVIIGLFLTLVGALIYLVGGYRTLNTSNKPQVLMAALISVAFMPFLLPKMHDRYFYTAELLSIALILVDWRTFLIPLFLQVSTANVYWGSLRRKGYLYPFETSAVINLLVLAAIIWLYYRSIPAGPIKTFNELNPT